MYDLGRYDYMRLYRSVDGGLQSRIPGTGLENVLERRWCERNDVVKGMSDYTRLRIDE